MTLPPPKTSLPHNVYWSDEAVPFKKIEHIARGSFGSVDAVMRIPHIGQYYARKTLSINRRRKEKTLAEIQSEISVASSLEHFHVVKLVGTYSCGLEFSIIMQPVADGNLDEFLRDHSNTRAYMCSQTIIRWIGCLTQGIAYLHGKGIIHRHIKPQNILQIGDRVILTDFGLSEEFKERTLIGTNVHCTRNYWPPESKVPIRPGKKDDIFSLGTVFLELLALHSGVPLQIVWNKRPYSENLFEVHELIRILSSTQPVELYSYWRQVMLYITGNMLARISDYRPFADALAACWEFPHHLAFPHTRCHCIADAMPPVGERCRGILDASKEDSRRSKYWLARDCMRMRGTLQACTEKAERILIREMLNAPSLDSGSEVSTP